MSRQALPWAGMLLLVLILGIWPWLHLVDLIPYGSDAAKWVQRTHPSHPTWSDYVFFEKHFVGYRPVAALTYTLSGLISGYEPWAYRLVDIALHASVGALLFALYRALTGDRSPWGLLPPLIFFVHPASEDVVTYLARRSYSLACVLALGGLLAFIRTARNPDRPWAPSTWLAAALLVLGLLSNETAGVAVALLPILALHLRPDPSVSLPRALLPTIPALIGTALVLASRWMILGYVVGGYEKRYFAFTRNGRNLLRQVDDAAYLQVFEAALRYTAFPTAGSGEQALWLGTALGAVIAVGVVAFYAWHSLYTPARAWRTEADRLPAVLLAWLLGYALLYALTRNWFWRQGYPMVLPLSLLATVVARQTFTAHAPWWRTALQTLPQAALLLSLSWHSPTLFGPTPEKRSKPERLTQTVRGVLQDLRAKPIQGATQVWMAVPLGGKRAHDARTWARLLAEEPRLHFKVLAVRKPGTEEAGHSRPLIRKVGDELRLTGSGAWAPGVPKQLGIEETDRAVPLGALGARARHLYVWYFDGEVGQLVDASKAGDAGASVTAKPRKKPDRKERKERKERKPPR